MTNNSNNPPDVELQLTHRQATFLLENAIANHQLCTAMVVSIASESISQEVKMAKADRIVHIQKRFTEMMQLLRAAGAREPDDD